MVRRLLSCACALSLAAAALLSLSPAARAVSVTVVAEGLDNPRGVAVGPDGAVWVAEAGRGGAGPCFEGPEGLACLGASGAVTRIAKGKAARVLTGLPSVAAPDGSGASGPQGVSLQGNGNLYVAMGLGGTPEIRAALGPDAAALGCLLRASASRNAWRVVADLAAWEAANDPDAGQPGTAVDSNPVAVLAEPSGQVVVDAGANDLLRVHANGAVKALAVFPVRFVPAPPFLGLPPGAQIPMQPVPTSVARGDDGALYVGELTGFPFPVGAARVYRGAGGSAPGGKGAAAPPEVFAEGFTNIMGVAAAPDGGLWVLEIAHASLLSGDPTGGLWRVHPDGTAELVLTDGLILPGGLAVGDDGTVYVSNCGVCAGGGALLAVEP